jgi:hypothetical protein
MKMHSAKTALSAMLATALIMVSDGVLPEGLASPAVSMALSGNDGTVVQEGMLDATQARAKAQESVNALSGDIQKLKKSVIALNKDLRVLEEDLLFPANTQVNVFLSLDVGEFFTLGSVKLKLNGRIVTNHIYSERELNALARGGIHKLHMANLSVGRHTLSAYFTGIGPSGREYKRGTTLKIDKQNGPKYVELRISDSSRKLQPEFSVQEW